MDSALCKKIFDSGTFDDEIESSSARNFVFESSRSLFVDFGRQLKLETVPFEMTRAIFNCLKTTNPLPLWLSGQDILDIKKRLKIPAPQPDLSGDYHFFEGDSDYPVQALRITREWEFINYFYGKYNRRIAGNESVEHHSQIHSFVFQDVYGDPIGAVALAEVVSPHRTVHIHHLRAFALQRGNGTQMLLELCRKADCFNVRLTANPAFNPDDKFPHKDFKVLSGWYEKFGFKGDSGLCRIPRQG